MAESNFQISSSSAHDGYGLPSDFQFLKVLGRGGFGQVLECLKKDTKQIVAVKIPLYMVENSTEVSMMEKLMRLNLDQHNIVQFLGWFHTSCGKAMVFESLDISLEDFILQRDCAPMLLSDVRAIIQQLATAFDALKLIKVIHTDLKPDNVMMVDHGRRPLRAKLIDFGLAIHRSRAEQGTTMQVVSYRAPEIILGLPFTEAIDMWSLGCITAVLLHGSELFPGETEYELLHDIAALLGLPEDYLLDDGLKTEKFFTQTESSSWRLKTHREYGRKQQQYQTGVWYCLESFRMVRLESKNRLEAVQRAQCIDLLEAMLCLDGSERITPIEILTHPFIRSNIKKNRIRRSAKTTTHDPAVPPPGVILVRPADAENRLLQEGPSTILVLPAPAEKRLLLDTDEEISEESPAALSDIETESSTPSPTVTPPGVILVRPADAENRLLLDTHEEISEEPPAVLSNIETESSTPSPTAAPPGVILVRPAAAAKMEDEERAARSPTGLNSDTTSEAHDGAETQNKAAKKKNCVRRLFSWLKKNFGSCCTAAADD